MVNLGLLKGEPAKLIGEKKYMQFYMHNLGHFLGIDVHDAGKYYFKGESRPAEPGMVMTIEPGLYISPDTSNIPEEFNQDIPDKYLGIGVRIEDDVLVTENGARVLTHKVPKDPGVLVRVNLSIVDPNVYFQYNDLLVNVTFLETGKQFTSTHLHI